MLQGAIQTNNGKIENLTSTVNSFDARINNAETLVRGYENRMRSVEDSIIAINNKIGSADDTTTILGRLKAIEQTLTKLIDFGTYTIPGSLTLTFGIETHDDTHQAYVEPKNGSRVWGFTQFFNFFL